MSAETLYKHCMICQRVAIGDKWIPIAEFKVKYPGASATSGYCSEECCLESLKDLTPELREKIIKTNRSKLCRLSSLKPS